MMFTLDIHVGTVISEVCKEYKSSFGVDVLECFTVFWKFIRIIRQHFFSAEILIFSCKFYVPFIYH